MKVADLFLPNTRKWNVEQIRDILPGFEKEILCIKPSMFEAVDKHVWLPQASGEYTTKTGYHTACSATHNPLSPAEMIRDFNWQTEI